MPTRRLLHISIFLARFCSIGPESLKSVFKTTTLPFESGGNFQKLLHVLFSSLGGKLTQVLGATCRVRYTYNQIIAFQQVLEN